MSFPRSPAQLDLHRERGTLTRVGSHRVQLQHLRARPRVECRYQELVPLGHCHLPTRALARQAAQRHPVPASWDKEARARRAAEVAGLYRARSRACRRAAWAAVARLAWVA